MKTFGYLILLLLLAGCEKVSDRELLVGNWQLTSVLDKEDDRYYYYPDTLDSMVSMEITDSGLVWLSGYCNSGMAEFTYENNHLRFYDAILTEMYCNPVGMLWEDYLYQLVFVYEYQVSDNHLSLFTNSNYDLFFHKTEDP